MLQGILFTFRLKIIIIFFFDFCFQSPRGVRSPVFQKQFLPRFGSQSPHNSPMRSTVSTPNLQQGRTVIAKTIGSVKSLVHNFDKSDVSVKYRVAYNRYAKCTQTKIIFKESTFDNNDNSFRLPMLIRFLLIKLLCFGFFHEVK